MKDIFPLIKNAIEDDVIEEFIGDLNGDLTLTYSVSEKPVIIRPYAKYESQSGANSLEHIFNLAKKARKEVAYTGIINEKSLRMREFLRGETGSQNLSDWEAGTLLKDSYAKTKEKILGVTLGHSHPKGFGALPSVIKWERERDWKEMGDEISLKVLESGTYKHFGADYCIMLEYQKANSLISRFAWIMSPRENQIGAFKVKEKGQIIYHPWKVE